jgi:hypothetical protein
MCDRAMYPPELPLPRYVLQGRRETGGDGRYTAIRKAVG